MIDKEKAIEDLKMLHGYPPYHGGGNICEGDGYFAASLRKKYRVKSIDELEQKVDFEKYHRAWKRVITNFPK